MQSLLQNLKRVSEDLVAVSYTHLDVYKRQGEQIVSRDWVQEVSTPKFKMCIRDRVSFGLTCFGIGYSFGKDINKTQK